MQSHFMPAPSRPEFVDLSLVAPTDISQIDELVLRNKFYGWVNRRFMLRQLAHTGQKETVEPGRKTPVRYAGGDATGYWGYGDSELGLARNGSSGTDIGALAALSLLCWRSAIVMFSAAPGAIEKGLSAMHCTCEQAQTMAAAARPGALQARLSRFATSHPEPPASPGPGWVDAPM